MSENYITVTEKNIFMHFISDYLFGVRLVNNLDGKVLITFNARNDHDRQKFVEDLKEAILEVRETKLKILKKIKLSNNMK